MTKLGGTNFLKNFYPFTMILRTFLFFTLSQYWVRGNYFENNFWPQALKDRQACINIRDITRLDNNFTPKKLLVVTFQKHIILRLHLYFHIFARSRSNFLKTLFGLLTHQGRELSSQKTKFSLQKTALVAILVHDIFKVNGLVF